MAAVLGHVVTDAFMSSEITGSWLFWILVGAGVGIASAVTADSEGATMSDSPDDLLRLSGPPQNSIAVIP
jgi:hypothetical protein